MTDAGAIARVTRADLPVLSMDVPLDRDAHHSHELEETVVPGGEYLRLTLVGAPPEVYSRIGAAFDVLLEQADHDPDRPLIEFYRREDEIDCLVPVRSAG